MNRLICGDCLAEMAKMPAASVDAIITDLPYGTTRNVWDVPIPPAPLWAEFNRLAKPRAAVVLFAQQPFAADLITTCREAARHGGTLRFKYEWIWEKNNATGFLNCHVAPLKMHENILIFSKASAGYNKDERKRMAYYPQMASGKPYSARQGTRSTNYNKANMEQGHRTTNHGTRFPRDVLRFPCERHGLHPTAKPVDLLRYLIRTYTPLGGVILDCCAGSCSTAIAALREKRHYICIEQNEHYCDVGRKRIEQEQIEPQLF